MPFSRKTAVMLVIAAGFVLGVYQNCSSPEGSGQLEVESEDGGSSSSSSSSTTGTSSTSTTGSSPPPVQNCVATANVMKWNGSQYVTHVFQPMDWSATSSADCHTKASDYFKDSICKCYFTGNPVGSIGNCGPPGGTPISRMYAGDSTEAPLTYNGAPVPRAQWRSGKVDTSFCGCGDPGCTYKWGG